MCDRLHRWTVSAACSTDPAPSGAFLLRAVLAPPWSLRIEDEAPLTLMAVLAGEAWVLPAGGRPGPARRRATPRSRVGPEPYLVADDPTHPAAGSDPARAGLP